jgi:hypothetical protein
MARQESFLISCGSFTRFGIFRSELVSEWVSECSLFLLAWFWWWLVRDVERIREKWLKSSSASVRFRSSKIVPQVFMTV